MKPVYGRYGFFGVLALTVACSNTASPGGGPIGNDQLGIVEFAVTELPDHTLVVGLGGQGEEVGRLDLVHGRFTLSPFFADDYDTPEVDGRKLEVTILQQHLRYETAGYDPVLDMPAHPPEQWAVAAFLDDPHVKPVLTRWQIGYQPFQGVGTAGAEVAFDKLLEVGFDTYDCSGQSNCGTVNGKTMNTCGGGASATSARRYTQNDCMLPSSGYDQYKIQQCCPANSGGLTVAWFAHKSCPHSGSTSSCGTGNGACKGCSQYASDSCAINVTANWQTSSCSPGGYIDREVAIYNPIPPEGCPSNCYWNSGSGCCTLNGTCFVAGTPITMADGTTRAIETLREGDAVMAYDTALGRMAPSTVTHTFVHEDSDAGTMLINGSLQATPNHPFFANGQWVRADALRPGDTLVTLATDPLAGSGAVALSTQAMQLSTIEAIPGTQTVYNIEVAGYHDYFAGGVLVHNKEEIDWCTCAPQ